MNKAETIEDLKKLAISKLPESYFAYFATGAHAEKTLENNEKVYSNYSIIHTNTHLTIVKFSCIIIVQFY